MPTVLVQQGAQAARAQNLALLVQRRAQAARAQDCMALLVRRGAQVAWAQDCVALLVQRGAQAAWAARRGPQARQHFSKSHPGTLGHLEDHLSARAPPLLPHSRSSTFQNLFEIA